MQQEILKSGLISKLIFLYQDGIGLKKKEQVTLKYMDSKYCYFQCLNTINFHKPKWRTKATIIAYTPEGVYESVVIIRDTSYSQNEILFEVDIPKNWSFQQMRAGSRKKVNLPVNIKFSDDVVIEAHTEDLSIGGLALVTNHKLTTVQKSFNADCTILFPKDLILNFPDGILKTDVKFVRQRFITDNYEQEGYSIVSFKFLKLTTDQAMILKSFLMKL